MKNFSRFKHGSWILEVLENFETQEILASGTFFSEILGGF
jgi:hypothetical protein